MIVGLGLALASIVSIEPRDPGLRLEWDAPLECPDPRWAADRIAAYLGRPLDDETDAIVTVHVRAQAAGFVLDLATEAGGVRDHQQLTHHDCAALVEIAASLAAISIDPLASGGLRADPHRPPRPDWGLGPALHVEVQRPATQVPTAKPLPIRTPAPPAKRPASPPPLAPAPDQPLLYELYADPDVRDVDRFEPKQPPRTQVSLGASAGLALELFPNPAPELRGTLGVSRGGDRAAFRGELLGGAILAGRFRSDDGQSGGDLIAWELGVRPCGVPRWGLVELRVCAAIGGGQIRARGVNVEPPRRRVHPWLWLSSELGLAFALSERWALFVDVGATFNLYRPTFSISNPDTVFETPIASARGRFGVELRFF